MSIFHFEPIIIAYGFSDTVTTSYITQFFSKYGTIVGIETLFTSTIQLNNVPITNSNCYSYAISYTNFNETESAIYYYNNRDKFQKDTFVIYKDDIQLDNKVFIGMLPLTINEQDLFPLLSSFGTILELILVRDSLTHQSKGCCFCKFENRQSAIQTIYTLNNKYIYDENRPIIAKFADTRKQKILKQRKRWFSSLSDTEKYTLLIVSSDSDDINNTKTSQKINDTHISLNCQKSTMCLPESKLQDSFIYTPLDEYLDEYPFNFVSLSSDHENKFPDKK